MTASGTGFDGDTDAETAVESEGDGSFADQELIPFLVVAGILLAMFPEPITSAVGVVLVLTGLGLWLRDLLRPGD